VPFVDTQERNRTCLGNSRCIPHNARIVLRPSYRSQDGASLAYVKEQMGHSSIQVTVDTYAHLIPGANVNWVDRLDSPTTPQQDATQAPGR